MSTILTINIDGIDRNVTQLDATAQAFSAGTGVVNSLVDAHSMININTKYLVNIGAKSHNILVSGTISLIQEDDKFRAVVATGGGWIAGELAATATMALATGVAVLAGVATAPVAIVGIAVLGVSAGAVGGYYGSEKSKDIYDALVAWFGLGNAENKNTRFDVDSNGTTVSTTDPLVNAISEFQFITNSSIQNWDIRATIPSVSNPESYAEQLKYDSTSKTATVKTPNSTTLNEGTTLLLKKDINQITINNHTADVATPTNLQLRNALTSIDDYQFLLSNILIKSGEKLDMGAAGVITVSSGDTLSQLGVQYLEQALEEFLEVA